MSFAASAAEIERRRQSPAFRHDQRPVAPSVGGGSLVAGRHGRHALEDTVPSNQCMEKRGGEVKQHQREECEGEVEVRIPEQRMQARRSAEGWRGDVCSRTARPDRRRPTASPSRSAACRSSGHRARNETAAPRASSAPADPRAAAARRSGRARRDGSARARGW